MTPRSNDTYLNLHQTGLLYRYNYHRSTKSDHPPEQRPCSSPGGTSRTEDFLACACIPPRKHPDVSPHETSTALGMRQTFGKLSPDDNRNRVAGRADCIPMFAFSGQADRPQRFSEVLSLRSHRNTELYDVHVFTRCVTTLSKAGCPGIGGDSLRPANVPLFHFTCWVT